MCHFRVNGAVVSLSQRVQGGKLRVVDHQIGAFGERAIAFIAADAALSGRPWARTVDDAVAGLAQLGRELLGEGDIAMSDEDGAHDSLSCPQSRPKLRVSPRPL